MIQVGSARHIPNPEIRSMKINSRQLLFTSKNHFQLLTSFW
nr:MAG TPA: hypothetical protein [Caudoviricetes sp.]DAW78050.1 MAG TPA: hypothetical protein [Caudoviricetes sp.]